MRMTPWRRSTGPRCKFSRLCLICHEIQGLAFKRVQTASENLKMFDVWTKFQFPESGRLSTSCLVVGLWTRHQSIDGGVGRRVKMLRWEMRRDSGGWLGLGLGRKERICVALWCWNEPWERSPHKFNGLWCREMIKIRSIVNWIKSHWRRM